MNTQDLLARLTTIMGREFIFIDTVISIDPGIKDGRIEAEFLYNPQDPKKLYLTAHLLDDTLMPGVLLLEGVAQTSGLLAIASDPAISKVRSFGYDGARFKKEVRPGEKLRFWSTVAHCSPTRGIWKFASEVNNAKDEVVCTATYWLYTEH